MLRNLQRNCDDVSSHRIDRNVDSDFSSDGSGFDSGGQNENFGDVRRSVVAFDASDFASETKLN